MKEFNKIFEEAPKKQLWGRLDSQLDSISKVKKLRRYRIASLAAMFIAFIAVVSYFNHILNDHNPHLFASNEGFSSMILEDLEYDANGIFNLEGLIEIGNAYKKSNNAIERSIAGTYSARDGEIGLQIGLKDMYYSLDFSYDGFPTLFLERIEGQTWYFRSKTDKTLKLNLEPYGFKLIDSNFLPEYKGYMFTKLNSI